MPDDVLAAIVRWYECGGVVDVLSRRRDHAVVSLRTCDAGEEMARLHTDDHAVLRWIDEHLGRCCPPRA
ncbi:hypothetical protein ACPXCG_07875 [Gordonia sp. DT218]|uniref:hypothetical protein n=1 Tax=Gordonia sp. DT101 TaxID=3416545 RepID=UPI003CF3E95F